MHSLLISECNLRHFRNTIRLSDISIVPSQIAMLKEYGHSPAGDRKLFTLGDSTLLWKNNNVLCLDGARANEIMQSRCKLMICVLSKYLYHTPGS